MDKPTDFLSEKYKNYVITPVTSGGTNELYMISRNDETRLVKIAGINSEDIVNEYNALQLLSEAKETPKVYELFHIGQRAAIEMEFIRGRSMLDLILEQNDRQNIYFYFEKLGRALSNLHSQYLSNANAVRKGNVIRKIAVPDTEDLLEVDYVPRELFDEAVSMLKNIKLNDCDLILTHGDFGYHNTIIAEDGTAILIDWEFAELNHPLNDIANVFFWTHLHSSEDAKERCRRFISAYAENAPIRDEGLLMPFCVYKVLLIMKRTLNLPDHVKNEWVRRLRWVMSEQF